MSVCLRVSSHVHVCDRVFACERVCERMWCLCMCVSVCELALPVVFPCRESAAWNVRLDRRRSHRLVPHPPAGCPHPPFSHASLEREVGPGLPCGWGLSQSAGWGRVMSVALLCPGLFSSQTEVPSGQGQGPSGPQALERERGTRGRGGRVVWSAVPAAGGARAHLWSFPVTDGGGAAASALLGPRPQAENRVGQGEGCSHHCCPSCQRCRGSGSGSAAPPRASFCLWARRGPEPTAGSLECGLGAPRLLARGQS